MIKNYKQLTTWLLATLMLWATAGAKATAAEWTDVTSRFVTNPDFNNGNYNGWTESHGNGSTVGVSQQVMRFYDTSFTFQQQLTRLPKGTYRLTVQGFYRVSTDSYNDYKNGTESITALLFGGSVSVPLASVYSEWMTSNVGQRQEHDGHYYPDNSSSSAAAFAEGCYQSNSIVFEADGSTTIGIRCQEYQGGNYCVFDNFKLEYDGDPDVPIISDGWIDVTKFLVSSPTFDGNSADGWQWENDGNCNIRVESMEFWQASFHIWQDLTGLPSGKYRLSVQSYYRQGRNDESYSRYKNGTENMTAYMYAGDQQKTLVSPYSYELPYYTDGCWTYQSGDWWSGNVETHYFPNTMESAAVAFANGAYWNTLEFEADGDATIGLRNDNWASDNWCIFDNFKLEYQSENAKATSLSVSLQMSEIMPGLRTKATVTVQPADALKWVNWSSSDETVATISDDGTITGVGTGTATITAKAIDGSGVSGTATVRVVINPPTATSLVINEIMASNVDEFISPAFNFDGWVELYNPTSKPVTLAGCYLSTDAQNLKAWRIPADIGVLPADGYAVVWFDSNDIAPQNAPFKLDVDGGTVYISDQDGYLVAQQSYPSSLERISYARTTDGSDTWGMACQATPGASNSSSAFATQQLDAPVVDQPSQLFEGSLTVSVDIPSGCTLRYTTDGKLPTADYGETSYDGQFTIDWTTTLRLRLFRNGWLPSRVTSRSYIYKDRNYTLPVVSVVVDPDFIYSSEIGVFEKGPNGRPGNGQSENCNWNMNWERPVNFSYLGADGQMTLNQDVDLEMCGGWSRAWSPHSFKLKGTKETGGVKFLPYQFFTQKPYIRNRTLQIRNGGNDTGCRIKDASIQYIVETSGLNVDCQSYQPIHEFINGKYIGVLNVREPNNKHFVEANYGWDDDEIDQFEMSPDSGYVQKCGTPDAFLHLVDDLSPNAANADTYAEIEQLLDMDEYVNYMAIELFLGSTDWPRNNIKGFRNKNGGKFRLVLYDLDGAFDTWDPFGSFFDKEWWTFDQLYPTSLGRIYDQIRLVTLFKNLLANDTFRKKFIDAYCIILGSVFETNRVNTIIDKLVGVARPAMNLTGESPDWTANDVKSQLANRRNESISFLQKCELLQIDRLTELQVNLSSNIHEARLMINGQDVPTAKFDGTLFAPTMLKAMAPEGYVFQGWQNEDGTVVSTTEEYDISDNGNVTLTAVYQKLTDDNALKEAIAMPIKVNEVNAAGTVYLGETWKRADWIELYNTTESELDVRGLYLSDDSDQPLKYQIQQSAKIPAGGHLVIWADGLGSGALGGQARQVHTNFKLSNKAGQQVFAISSAEFVENNANYFNKHPEMKTFVDGLTYTAHTGQQSVGRYPDGGRQFYLMDHPTIERTNTVTTTDKVSGQDQNLMSLLSEEFKLQLAKGWNWTSHCLANSIRPANLSSKAARIVGQRQECIRTTQGMTGTLTLLEAGHLYKVQMNEADTYTATDIFCQPELPITLLPGWNWVGYPVSGTQTLAEAMAEFTAEEGDQIIGQDGFAVYTNNKWTGALSSLETGKGYMLYTHQAKTLTFTKPTQSLNLSRANTRGKAAIDYGIDKYAYPDVMGFIGTLEWQNQPVEPGRFTLLAYSDGECRGVATWVDDMLFLTAYGEGGEPLQFYAKDEEDGAVYNVNVNENVNVFKAGISGTTQSPCLFSIGEAQPVGIDTVNSMAANGIEGYYNLGGLRVGSHAAALPRGVYIVRMSNGSHRKIYVK